MNDISKPARAFILQKNRYMMDNPNPDIATPKFLAKPNKEKQTVSISEDLSS